MEANATRLKIAVVGGGVAGVTAAFLLARRYEVTLLERERYVGGHTNTIEVTEPDGRTLPVDTGFIVCNAKNYPLFYRLLDLWEVPRRDSDMSFGFWCEAGGIGYTGPWVRQFLRRPSNLLDRRLLGMVLTQRRFNRRALRDLEGGEVGEVSLGAYLQRVGVGDFFVRHYLLPLSASVWSSPDRDMLDFPARTFLRFFANHGLLQLGDFPTWQTVVGGSAAYVRAFGARFAGRVMTGAEVVRVRREDGGVTVTLADGSDHRFDKVVLASHADQSLALLADPTEREQALLGAWRYHRNHTVLHSDVSVMPPDRRVWASWNYVRPADAGEDEPVPITYHMNRLQGLVSERDYLVSLNLRRPVDPGAVIYEVDYTHPVFTERSVATQAALRELGGTHDTFFCGSYLGYGFHEDAVASAVAVAEKLGVGL